MSVPTSQSARVMRKRFGAWVKEQRETVGMTQLELAALLDYGYAQVVSQVERGLTTIPTVDLHQWATALRVDPVAFGKKYVYYCEPHIYAVLYGIHPLDVEKVPRESKTIMPMPGRAPKRPARGS